MSSYAVTSVVTQAGIAAAIAAGSTGPSFLVTGFQIGSASAADGAQALPTDTSVTGLVYTGTLSQLAYTIIDQDTVMWTISLDTTVGNFEIGNIGILMTGNVLLCKAVFPTESLKYVSNPPSTVGNVKYYKILMRLASITSLINLTIVESETASLPEVPTELVLPPADSSPFDCYMVDNHTHIGVPTTALRLNGNWFHAPHHLNPDQGIAVISCSPSLFGTTAPTIGPVYLSASTSKFEAADGLLSSKQAIGVRTSTFEVTVTGQAVATLFGVFGTLTPGTYYYVNTGINAGKLTNTPIGNPIAIAVSSTDLFVSSSLNADSNPCEDATLLTVVPPSTTLVLGCDGSGNLIKFPISMICSICGTGTGTGTGGGGGTGTGTGGGGGEPSPAPSDTSSDTSSDSSDSSGADGSGADGGGADGGGAGGG